MKRTELFFSVLLVPLDFFLLILSAWLAYSLRFQAFIVDIKPVLYNLPLLDYLQLVVVVAFLWMLIFALLGLYHRRATDPWWPEAARVLLGCSAGFVVVVLVVFFRRELLSSRFIFLAAWGIAVVLVSLGRLAVRLLQKFLFHYGIGLHQVVVIGQGGAARKVAEEIQKKPELGYRLLAQLPANVDALLGLKAIMSKSHVDEILFADPNAEATIRQTYLEFSEYYHKTFRYAPDVLRSPLGRPVVNIDLGIPIIEVPETTLVGWGRVLKRLIDIIGGVVGLIIFAPLFILLIILIKLDSVGPVFYLSKRVARGRTFTLYKFRTMRLETCVGDRYGGEAAAELYEQLINTQSKREGPVPKIINDPRWTKLGKWLRRFSLDELPQFFNILKGDMSLVGPRPHYPSEVARYAKHHRKVLAIKPGLTGLAQVNGRSDLDFDDEVRLDRYYIEHWSIWLDIRIMLKTIIAIFKHRQSW